MTAYKARVRSKDKHLDPRHVTFEKVAENGGKLEETARKCPAKRRVESSQESTVSSWVAKRGGGWVLEKPRGDPENYL